MNKIPALLLLVFLFPLSSMAQKKDTVYISGTDTFLVRKFNKQNKLKNVDIYVKKEYVAYRSYNYTDSTYGYEQIGLNNDSGLVRHYYLDGKPYIATALYDYKNSGPYLTFYDNGNPQCKCFYVNGKREGMQRTFHENGQPRFVGAYRNGLKDGPATVYYDNGSPEYTCTYKDDKETDTTTYYYRDGSVWSRVVYRDGIPYEVIENNGPSGTTHEKGTLKNGTGTLYLYDEQGKLLQIQEYKEGKLNRVRKKEKK